MEGNEGLEFIKTHGTDIAVGVFAIGAVIGSSAWIVAAGLVAGGNLAFRLARGEFVTIGDRFRLKSTPLRMH